MPPLLSPSTAPPPPRRESSAAAAPVDDFFPSGRFARVPAGALGTTFNYEFFDLPGGYASKDIKTIHSGMVYSESGGLRPFSLDSIQSVAVFREKPFFTCYVDGLDA